MRYCITTKRLVCIQLIFLFYGYICKARNPLSQDFINEINSKQSLWTAGKNFDDATSVEDIRKLIGQYEGSKNNIRPKSFEDVYSDDIPEEFDAREQWPDCESIKDTPDQSACDSSWFSFPDRRRLVKTVTKGNPKPDERNYPTFQCDQLDDRKNKKFNNYFGESEKPLIKKTHLSQNSLKSKQNAVVAASCMSDRICIHSEGKKQVRVSAANLISCCDYCGFGCRGGDAFMAFTYWGDEGVVTGGWFNSSEGCQPYPFAPCEHYSANGSYSVCPKRKYPTPDCSNECTTTTESYENSLTYGEEEAYSCSNETEFLMEIFNNGPAAATMFIYEDFFNYKSGIYNYTDGDDVGILTVRLIGWGVEDDVKYWLAVNSWNEDWGDKGLFKIVRGENACGIEDILYANLPVF